MRVITILHDHHNYLLSFLVAVPIWQAFTLVANLSEHKDSPIFAYDGLILTNMSVLQLPPTAQTLLMNATYACWSKKFYRENSAKGM